MPGDGHAIDAFGVGEHVLPGHRRREVPGETAAHRPIRLKLGQPHLLRPPRRQPLRAPGVVDHVVRPGDLLRRQCVLVLVARDPGGDAKGRLFDHIGHHRRRCAGRRARAARVIAAAEQQRSPHQRPACTHRPTQAPNHAEESLLRELFFRSLPHSAVPARTAGASLSSLAMPQTLDGQLVVAISSRALFDFEEENRLFESHDDRAYMALQLGRLEQPAPPGVAFSLVRKLLAFNLSGQPPRGGSGHPVAQRSGLGHAGLSLGPALRVAGAARRVHARRGPVALSEATGGQSLPVGQ